MALVTVIGRGTRIEGRVSGAVDLEIQGHVDGEVAVDGDVTVDVEGLVGANVTGRRVIVRGAVRGDLRGEDAVLLEEGARVVGDVRAPRVAIAPGALVRGYVQTGDADRGSARGASRAQAASATARVQSKPTTTRATPAATPAAPRAASRQPTISIAGAGAGTGGQAKGPPAPVVPALRKGAKGAMKKRA